MTKTKILIPRGTTYKMIVALYYTSGIRFASATAAVTAYAKRQLEQPYYDIELHGSYTNGSDGAAWLFTFQPDTTDQLAPGQYFFEIRVDGTDSSGTDYSYVAVSVDDADLYIVPSVKTPLDSMDPSQASIS